MKNWAKSFFAGKVAEAGLKPGDDPVVEPDTFMTTDGYKTGKNILWYDGKKKQVIADFWGMSPHVPTEVPTCNHPEVLDAQTKLDIEGAAFTKLTAEKKKVGAQAQLKRKEGVRAAQKELARVLEKHCGCASTCEAPTYGPTIGGQGPGISAGGCCSSKTVGGENPFTSDPSWWPELRKGVEWNRGHLFAGTPGGAGGSTFENLTPLYPKANQTAMRRCEDRIGNLAKCGFCVRVTVKVNYLGKDYVPERITISATADHTKWMLGGTTPDVTINNTENETVPAICNLVERWC